MKPKEQAEKLYNECWRVTPQPYRVSKLKRTKFKGLLFQDWDKDWTNALAKKCALICVDIQLSNAGFIWGGHNHETGNSARDEYRKYWNEVKSELEKL